MVTILSINHCNISISVRDQLDSGFTKLHVGLVVLVKTMLVFNNFLLQNTNLVSDLSKIFLKFCQSRLTELCTKNNMSDRTLPRLMTYVCTKNNMSDRTLPRLVTCACTKNNKESTNGMFLLWSIKFYSTRLSVLF